MGIHPVVHVIDGYAVIANCEVMGSCRGQYLRIDKLGVISAREMVFTGKNSRADQLSCQNDSIDERIDQ